MSTTGALVCWVPEMPSEETLRALRKGLPAAAGITEDDFYVGGVLIVIRDDADLPFDVPAPLPLLDVNLWRNYFNEHYRRGDPSTFVRCAEYLEEHLPGVRIYYGPIGLDGAVEFTPEYRAELLRLRGAS